LNRNRIDDDHIKTPILAAAPLSGSPKLAATTSKENFHEDRMRNLFEKTREGKKILSFYSWLKLFFYILSVFYGIGYHFRVLLYQSGMVKPKKLEAKVISIGNVTLGGTGKTPLVIYLSQKLKEKELKVAILTRGYKRKKKGLVELVGENKNRIAWTGVGDEPYLLASRLHDVPVIVSKNRRASGAYAERKYPAEVLVLDDGFQHWKLSRDLDIVVIDAANPFGNSKLFPAGILREPLSSLKRADIFVLNKTDQVSSKQNLIHMLKSYNQDAPIVESEYKIKSIERWFDHSLVEKKNLEGKKCLAFSGIGNPVSFEKSLKLLNVEVLKHHKFPDHFFYQKKELLNLEKETQELSADFMITTEKDSIRIPMMSELEIPIYVFKIDLVITKGEEIFWKKIEGLIQT
jgi:tetraacyldisaccharide 4'-kinase